MLTAYLDESYDSSFYFIGAAIADNEAWDRLAIGYSDIRALTASLHGTGVDAEFHGHSLMNACDGWSALFGKHRETAGIYRAALIAAANVGVQYIFRGVDVQRLNARYRYPDQPHKVVLGHLLERIEQFADSRHEDEPIAIVADEIATQAEHQVQFRSYQEVGTPGYRSSNLPHLADHVDFESSDAFVGLQAIDMALYVRRRLSDSTVGRNRKALATRSRLWACVSPSVYHNWVWEP